MLSTSVVCIGLTSAGALAQIPKVVVTQGETTVVVQEVYVQKEAAPSKKSDPAQFEALRKAMIEAMRQKSAQPEAKAKLTGEPRKQAVKKEGAPSKKNDAQFEAMTKVLVEAIFQQAARRRAGVQEEVREVRRQEVMKKQAARAAVRVAPGRAFQANQDAQLQQFMQQFRPMLRAEYHVVRVVCRLTTEQRKTIASAAEQVLREASRNYLDAMRRPMTNAQRAANDPRRLIQEGLGRVVKERLPAEQAARYQEELAKRNAGRKQLTVRNLVAKLDHDLVLGAEQRDKVSESLSAHWDDSWGQSLEMFMHDYAFLPPIPDQYVAPFLNETQKKIWRSTQRVQGFFGGFGMVVGMMEDDPAEDPELREARLAATQGGKREETEEEKQQARMRMELRRAQLEMQALGKAAAREKPRAKTP
jgi:hypothetical protein